jgi:hypothetical protein
MDPPPDVTDQVTLTPATGFAEPSSARTTKSWARAVLTAPVWGVPLTTTSVVPALG